MFSPNSTWSFRTCIRKLFAIFMLFIVCDSVLIAQNEVQKKLWNLSEEDSVKLKRADSYLNQGNEILFSNYFKEEQDSVHQEVPNYIELSENMYIGKKKGRLLYDTNEFYKTGFESKVEVYQGYIATYINGGIGLYKTEVKGLNDSISNVLRSARLERGKSKSVGALSKGGSLIHSSNKHYHQAVVFSQQAIGYIFKSKWHSEKQDSSDLINMPEESEEVNIASYKIPNEETKEVKDIEAVPILTVDQATIVKTVTVEEKKILPSSKKEMVKEEPKLKPKDDVYYTIQVMADRKPVSESRVRLVYKGNLPIVENQGDGWYRYSFGKFFTISDAKKALTISKTKGYVVAYKNKDRISISEAKTWFLSKGK